MPKRTYSLDAPHQQRLKIARAKIEGILKEHDLAAAVILHTPGMTEFFYDITPSYSCCWIDEAAAGMFGSIAPVLDRAMRAEHTEAIHKPDPMEARKQ